MAHQFQMPRIGKGTKQGVVSNDKGQFAISIKRKVYFISVLLCLNYFILNKG